MNTIETFKYYESLIGELVRLNATLWPTPFTFIIPHDSLIMIVEPTNNPPYDLQTFHQHDNASWNRQRGGAKVDVIFMYKGTMYKSGLTADAVAQVAHVD
jgi:hypothetical protein